VDDPTPIELFKWTLLFDLVEDYYGLWEQPWIDEESRVEQGIRELHRDGLIYLFRVPSPDLVNESGVDPTLRLSEAELDRELDRVSGTDWSRVFEPDQPELPDIWIGPTAEGEAAVNDPPAAIRKLLL
jgi:hypothetical protein